MSGASRGIGRAIAEGFLAAGAAVVISSRKPENIEPAAAELDALYSGRVHAVVAHAGRPEDARRLVAEAVGRFDRLDIAVNNASTNPHFGPLLDAEESQWDKILEVNLKGYFWLCQAAARRFIAQVSGGKIINVASVAGLVPDPLTGIYSVSKAGVIMLTRLLAVELGPNDIQVNAIAPGFIKTRFSRALWANPEISQAILERTPAGRIAEPEEVVGAALYLASSASDFTTGLVLTVDGGYTLT
ncbi:MAG: SDR family oxidoreductase [Candidatus Promineifilaceae bacterium]